MLKPVPQWQVLTASSSICNLQVMHSALALLAYFRGCGTVCQLIWDKL